MGENDKPIREARATRDKVQETREQARASREQSQAIRKSVAEQKRKARELLQRAKFLLKRFDQTNPFKAAKPASGARKWKLPEPHQDLNTQEEVRRQLQKALTDLGTLRMISPDDPTVRDLKRDIRKTLAKPSPG